MIYKSSDTIHIRQFISLCSYLNDLFIQYPLTLITKNELTIPNLEFNKSYSPSVSMQDRRLENNLRMIESYLPEIHFAFAAVSNQTDSITQLVEKLAERKIPYDNPAFSKRFLQYKMMRFFEALLFTNLFNGVWNGDFLTDRIFVFKEEAELRYYHYFQIQSLLIKLLDMITVKSISKKEDLIYKTVITFELQPSIY